MAIKIRPFNDSYVKSRRRASSDQNTSTGGFDAHRQGVELTLAKHYTLGMVTVHSGYSGQDGNHEAPQFVYGQTQKTLLDERYHRDVVPSTLTNFFYRTPSSSDIIIDSGTDLDVDVRNFDGVIEPFDIRDIVALKPVPMQYGRKMWAALGEGNVADRRGSDVIVHIVKKTDAKAGSFAMVDSSDHFGDILTTAESITTDNRVRAPFTENYPKKGIVTSLNMEVDVTAALSAMSPGTENLLPEGYTQPGASGFDYGPTVGVGPRVTFSNVFQRPEPEITSLSLAYAFDEGGEALTIYGLNFASGATVTIGPSAAGSVVWVNAGEITCTVPAFANLSGRATVTVRNPDGMEATSSLIYLENDMMNGFRLSLSSSDAVADVATSTTLYFQPYVHGRIALWNGSIWVLRTSNTAISLALGTLSSDTNYDVFAYDNSGTIALELSAAWASDTSRSDALTRLSGTLVKNADNTRRYIGTLRMMSTTECIDASNKRFLWNFYNQVERVMSVVDTTNTWTYANPNSVWRAARAQATNCFEYVCGDTTSLKARVYGHAFVSSTAAGNMAAVGIGIDSTTVNSAITYGGVPNSTTLLMTLAGEYMGLPSTGYHKITWLETGVGGAVTYTFDGDNGSATSNASQSGMVGSIKC